jgi:hypothetical protein
VWGVASRIRHLGLTTAVTAIVLAVAAGVAGLAAGMGSGGWAAGAVAALGVAAGVGLVAASYIASTLAIAWADSIAPRLVFGVGIGMYVTKFSLFAIMLIAINDSDWAGRIPMAWGMVVGVIAWIASQIWWTVRHSHPYVSTS